MRAVKPVSGSAAGPTRRRASLNDSPVDHSTTIRAGRSVRLQTIARSPVTSPSIAPCASVGRALSSVISAAALRGTSSDPAAAPESVLTNRRRLLIRHKHTRAAWFRWRNGARAEVDLWWRWLLRVRVLAVLMALSFFGYCATATGAQDSPLDQKVRRFLDSRRGSWRDMNVPWQDGQLLHDLIVKHRFKRALEIGTSTGHSSIWIAWALAKTGGKLITIEIDPGRHAEAVKNFEEAGVARFVDARLADAHELVKQLPGPFDFVFSDADKGWYTQYFKDVEPKLEVGGCFTAHNMAWRSGGPGAFLDYVRALPNYETTLEGSSEGVSVSCKR